MMYHVCADQKAMPSLRVLIVEDEALISLLIQSIVCDLGHQAVGCAYSVGQALALLEKIAESTDAALLDVNLGGNLVFPVAEALTARAIPFAFLTGYGALGIPERFAHATVMQKPFTDKDVAFAVDALRRECLSADSQAERARALAAV